MSDKYFVRFANLPDSPQFEVKNGMAVIGSKMGDIVLNAPTLGARHCTVSVKEGVFTIVDEGSPDGTFVNGEKIASGKKVVLQDDDEVLLGELGVQFVSRSTTDLNIALDKSGSYEVGNDLPPADEGVDLGDLTKIKGLSLEDDRDKTSRLSVQILTEDNEKRAAQEKAKMSESKQAKLLEEVKKRKEALDEKKKNKEAAKKDEVEEVPEGVVLRKNKKVAKVPFWKQILVALNLIKEAPPVDQDSLEEELNLANKTKALKKDKESDEPELVVRINKETKDVPLVKLTFWQKVLFKLKLFTPPTPEVDELEEAVDADEARKGDETGESPPPVDEKVIVTINEEEEVEVEDDSELDGFVAPINKIPIPIAHGLTRLLAIFFDLICSYSFWIIFSEFSVFIKAVNFARLELIKLISPFETSIKENLSARFDYQQIISSNYFTLFAVYIVFRFVSSGFLGVTFGQWLIGIKTNLHKKPMASRLIALWRATLGFVFSPLVFSDLLPLIGRRSLKEIFSFTVLFPPKKARLILSIILILPFLSIFALVSPLFRGFSLVQKVAFTEVRTLPTSGATRGEYTYSKYFNVKYYNLGPDFITIPNFSIEHINSKTMLFPTVSWLMRKGALETSWKKIGEFEWNNFVDLALTGNVVAQTKYPTLLNFSKNNSRPTDKENLPPTKLSMAEEITWRQELLDLISQVFNLHFDAKFLVQQVKTYGPFWNGLVDARSYFFKHFSNYGRPEVYLLALGDTYFLRVIPSKENIPYKEYLISLSANNPIYYEFTFKGLNDFSYVMTYFYVPMFEKAEFFPNQFEAPDQVRVPEATMVIDELAMVAVKEPLSATSAQNIANYYLDLGRQILGLANEKLSAHYEDALKNGTQLAAAVGSGLEEEHPHKRMVGQLGSLLESLATKDNAIWEAGLPPLADEVFTSTVENILVEEIVTGTGP